MPAQLASQSANLALESSWRCSISASRTIAFAMVSERIQRRIDSLLDEDDTAIEASDWALVRRHCASVLGLDPDNDEAKSYLAAADRVETTADEGTVSSAASSAAEPVPAAAAPAHPPSFVAGRYRVERFLGEGGRKRVFLAHDTTLDRDIAFAQIRTEGLDDLARERVMREAQSMARLGAYPNLVAIHDIGEKYSVARSASRTPTSLALSRKQNGEWSWPDWTQSWKPSPQIPGTFLRLEVRWNRSGRRGQG